MESFDMKKILISALIIGCFVLAGYVYTTIKPDDSSIAKNTPKNISVTTVAGAEKPSEETTANRVPARIARRSRSAKS